LGSKRSATAKSKSNRKNNSLVESKMVRTAHGLARGMGQQLESLGDGQIPHALAEAWFRMVSEKKTSK
jgi:hypothetical protein